MTCDVLIIEDEPLAILDIEQAVLDAGATVAGLAHTLDHAVEAMASLRFDAVVLDANLNGLSTEPIAVQLRRNQVPYDVVSGYNGEQLRSMTEGAPYVGKPFDILELAQHIVRLLARPHTRPDTLARCRLQDGIAAKA